MMFVNKLGDSDTSSVCDAMSITYSSQKQLPANIARALYDN